MPTYLPRKRKAELMDIIAPLCQKALDKFLKKHDLQKNELEDYCGLNPQQATQVSKGNVRETSLARLLEGGIILIKDIIAATKDKLTKEQIDYLRSLSLAENHLDMADLVAKLDEAGLKDRAKKLLEDLLKGK